MRCSILLALFLSSCAQVQAEAQATLDDAILAREMNRSGIMKAYERCNDLITAEFKALERMADDAETMVEASFWRSLAATLLNETKRDLLTVSAVRAIRDGTGTFKLDCFGNYKAVPYEDPASDAAALS